MAERPHSGPRVADALGGAEPSSVHQWQTRWADELVRQERCAAAFTRSRTEAEALLRRREASFAKCEGKKGPLQRAQVLWLTYRIVATWRSWLAAEKAERHFTQLMEELRQEEERFQNQQKALAAEQDSVSTEISLSQSRLIAQRERQRLGAQQSLLWLQQSQTVQQLQVGLRSWSSFASHAAGRVQLICHLSSRRDALVAFWAWHSSAAKSRRERKRSELEAKEAQLSQRQATSQRTKLLTYCDWLASSQRLRQECRSRCFSALQLWRRGVVAARWGLALGRRRLCLLALRAWSSWKDALVQAKVAGTCGPERQEALRAASAHRDQATAVLGRCWQSYETWCLLQAVVSWHRVAQSGSHPYASEQLEQEMQSSLADAATARLQLERHRDVLAAARSSRSSERSQLEAELADAQQALVQLQTDIATETSCVAELGDLHLNREAAPRRGNSSRSGQKDLEHELLEIQRQLRRPSGEPEHTA